MKSRFKARELWLFAPFLLIMAGAFYWQRIERITGPNGRAMYVSDVTIDAAPGRYQKFGWSHRVTVTISHPWPRPKWWGQNSNYGTFIEPLYYTKLKPAQRKALAPNVRAQGEAITYLKAGKPEELDSKFGGSLNDFRFDGTNYVSVDYFDLNNVPQKWGALTLHGAYAIAGQPILAFQREIRKAGKSLAIPLNKNPGAQLVSIDASEFYASTTTRFAGKPRPRETCSLRFVVRDLVGREVQGEKSNLIVTDVEVRDETGKKFHCDKTAGLEGNHGAKDDEQMQAYQALLKSLPSDESPLFYALDFAPTLQTKGRLTVRGQISMDDRWPIFFQVKLPPRAIKPAPRDGIAQFSVPLWRDGKLVKP